MDSQPAVLKANSWICSQELVLMELSEIYGKLELGQQNKYPIYCTIGIASLILLNYSFASFFMSLFHWKAPFLRFWEYKYLESIIFFPYSF